LVHTVYPEITAVCDARPCSFMGMHQSFRGTYCLSIQHGRARVKKNVLHSVCNSRAKLQTAGFSEKLVPIWQT